MNVKSKMINYERGEAYVNIITTGEILPIKSKILPVLQLPSFTCQKCFQS